jgi:MFS family permease
LLLITGRLELWQIYVLTFLNSLFTSFQWPAYSAATTMLVPQDQLGRASGMVQIGEGISQLISPAVAGFLFVAYGLQGVLLVDAATFLFAVATMLIVKVPEPVREPRPEGEKSSLWTEIRQGWDFIVARKGLLYLLLYFAVSNFVFGMLGPLITPILLSLGTVDQVGLASTVIGLSMLIGTIGVSVWGGPKKRVVGVLGPSLLSMLMMMAFAFPRSILGFTIVGFIMMLSMPLINASSQALWQSKTPPDLQGRVFSVRRTIAQFTGPIAVLMVGPLADQVFGPALDPGGALASGFIGQFLGVGDTRGEAFLFLILGVTGVVGTLFFWSLPALRNVQADLPDVEFRAADEAPALQEAEPAPAI